MRRRPLLLLSVFFLALCVSCLFYSGHSTNMLIALAVQLVFFVRYVIFEKSGFVSDIQKDNLSEEPTQEKEEEFTMEVPVTKKQNVRKVQSNII